MYHRRQQTLPQQLDIVFGWLLDMFSNRYSSGQETISICEIVVGAWWMDNCNQFSCKLFLLHLKNYHIYFQRELGPRGSIQWNLVVKVATAILKLHKDVICIDEGGYSSIMQDDGIYAIQRHIHQDYMHIATLMKATNEICVQFSHNQCIIFRESYFFSFQ